MPHIENETIISEAQINNETARAKSLAYEQSRERAGSLFTKSPQDRAASRRSAFFNVISGMAAGAKAAQPAIQAGDPLSAVLLGMGGAIQAPTFEEMQAAREAQIAEATLKQIEAMPIEKVSPGILAQYRELEGMPVGFVSKISSLLRQQEQYSNAMSLMLLRDKLRDEDRLLNDVEIGQISNAYGISASQLKGVRTHQLLKLLPKPEFNSITGETMMLRPVGALDKLEKVFASVPSGRVVGRGAELINKLTGLFPQVREANALINALIPQTARFIGGDVGNLNENEQERAAVALQLIDGTLEERRRGLTLLQGLAGDVISRERRRLSFPSGAEGASSFDARSEARRVLEERKRNRMEQK